MEYSLKDLVDIQLFQQLQDRLNELYSFPSAIIDNEGNILTATAWQDACTKFHRCHPELAKECIKSDKYLIDGITDGNSLSFYKCPQGLVDFATPIIVEGQHLGAFFFADAAYDFRPVMAGGLLKQARAVFHAAALGIIGTKIQPANACKADGLRAHGAWLQRDIEVTFLQARIIKQRTPHADNQQFGVGGRVGKFNDAVT